LNPQGLNFAFHIILDLVAFAALVCQIVSASYCCCVRGGGCAQVNKVQLNCFEDSEVWSVSKA